MPIIKIFYLWDLADTLFIEKWNKKLSGFDTYDDYVINLYQKPLVSVTPLEYELAYEKPYKEGLYNLSIADGFKEVLSWTKNNGVFTTGNKEQIDWRAVQLQNKYGFDVRPYIAEICSTFDYGNTNVKTKAMLVDLISKKIKQGFDAVVYTDDKSANCQFFIKAARKCLNLSAKFKFRVYNLSNNNSPLEKISDDYYKIGDLGQLRDSEEYLLNHHD
ncbi:MAG: hypothetical protein HY974_02990 [Candidatus Kerfeldbacteria bacterium]|nr:hypothetical protein [Candidatus Kerfeldbacteria bacterium]